MQQVKFTTIVAALFSAVLLGTVADAILNLGDTFKGTILVDDTDVVEFSAVAGQKLNVSVKADKGQGLLPQFRVVDLSTIEDVVPLTSSGKSKTSVKKVVLPSTGLYRIEVSGAEGTIGSYTLTTSTKIGKDVKSIVNEVGVGAEETQETPFDANTQWTLDGTIAASKKSEAVPFNPTIEGPLTEGGDPVELTGFITKKNDKFTIKDLVIPALGTYVISVENQGLSGVIKTSLKLKPNKTQKQTITEDGK